MDERTDQADGAGAATATAEAGAESQPQGAQGEAREDAPGVEEGKPLTLPLTSSRRATVGRTLHLYSPAWRGPRPCIVVNVEDEGQASWLVNVNVFLDGVHDTGALAQARASSQGNTHRLVPVYEPLTPAERNLFLERSDRPWAEWPLLKAGLI